MATAAKTKEREKLTLHDNVSLLHRLQQLVDENIDEIELNDGALPDWLAAEFDGVELAIAERVDAIAHVVDEFKGAESSAKATKDRAARRERVWGNVIKSIKAYAMREIQRSGGTRLEGKSAVLRIQRNGQPTTECTLNSDEILHIVDTGQEHALAKYFLVNRTASIDVRRLAAAYEARAKELAAEIETLSLSDLMDDDTHKEPEPLEQAEQRLAQLRQDYIRTALAKEFPGVICERGQHVRID